MMTLPMQRLSCFFCGALVVIAFNYVKNDRLLHELRMDKEACSFVWEEHDKPTITTNTGYWKDGVTECVVFDDGRFRSLTSSERISYEAALESKIRD